MPRLFAVCWIATAVLLFGTAGCSKSPQPSGQPAAAGDLKPAAAHGAGTTAPGGLKFAPREGWVEEAPSSSMRQAQYRLPKAAGDPEDAELVVFYFQGSGGGVMANIDRWIGQFTKADGSPANDAARTTKREVRGIPVTIVDVSGTYISAMGPMLQETKNKPGFRMLAAVAEASNGPWFFKLTGPSGTVARWEKSFGDFLDALTQ